MNVKVTKNLFLKLGFLIKKKKLPLLKYIELNPNNSLKVDHMNYFIITPE